MHTGDGFDEMMMEAHDSTVFQWISISKHACMQNCQKDNQWGGVCHAHVHTQCSSLPPCSTHGKHTHEGRLTVAQSDLQIRFAQQRCEEWIGVVQSAGLDTGTLCAEAIPPICIDVALSGALKQGPSLV